MSKPYILAAEDDEEDREIMGEVFKSVPCPAKIEFVEDGEELLQFLAGHPNDFPVLILTDLNMPRMNGTQLLATLKQDIRYKHIPVVVMSTSAWQEDVRLSYKAGANSFIPKPNDIKTWSHMLTTVCAYWFATALLPSS